MRKASLVIGWLWLMLSVAGYGQVAPPAEDWQKTFFEEPERALPLLVAAAEKHSAQVEAAQIEKGIAEQDEKISRRSILSSLQLTNSFGYGNVTNVTIGDQTVPSSATATSTKRYFTGVNLNIPLDRLVNRRAQQSRQKLEVQRYEAFQRSKEEEVSQRVLNQYQEVLMTHKMLVLRQQAYVSAQLNQQLAEKLFKDGTMSLAESSMITDRSLTAAVEQERAISTYTTAFLTLENLIGAKVSDVMTRK